MGSSPAGCTLCGRTDLSRDLRAHPGSLTRSSLGDGSHRCVHVAKEDRILDVTCGTEIVARLAREQLGAGSQITGVDLDPEMIAVARSI